MAQEGGSTPLQQLFPIGLPRELLQLICDYQVPGGFGSFLWVYAYPQQRLATQWLMSPIPVPSLTAPFKSIATTHQDQPLSSSPVGRRFWFAIQVPSLPSGSRMLLWQRTKLYYVRCGTMGTQKKPLLLYSLQEYDSSFHSVWEDNGQVYTQTTYSVCQVRVGRDKIELSPLVPRKTFVFHTDSDATYPAACVTSSRGRLLCLQDSHQLTVLTLNGTPLWTSRLKMSDCYFEFIFMDEEGELQAATARNQHFRLTLTGSERETYEMTMHR